MSKSPRTKTLSPCLSSTLLNSSEDDGGVEEVDEEGGVKVDNDDAGVNDWERKLSGGRSSEISLCLLAPDSSFTSLFFRGASIIIIIIIIIKI